MNEQQFYDLWKTKAHNTYEGGAHAHETYGHWAQQDEREFWTLIEEVSKIQPTRILEIGSAHGGTLFFWDQIAEPDATIVSVCRQVGSGITVDLTNTKSNLTLLKRDSHSPETVAEVAGIFEDGIDFIFIDGDHSYDGVKEDYENYSPLVRPGGLVGFHDICMAADDLSLHNMGVSKFFRELDVPNKKRIEHSFGIGIVYL